MKFFRYTQEMKEWAYYHSKNRGNKSYLELTHEFNQTFKTNVTLSGFQSMLSDYKTKELKEKSLKHTEEENKWIIENFAKYSRKKLAEEYNKKFNRNLYYRSLENYACILFKKRNIEIKRPKEVKDRKYFTQEEIDWVLENKPKMTSVELLAQYNIKFNKNIKSVDTLKRNFYWHGRRMAEVDKPIPNYKGKINDMEAGVVFEAHKHIRIRMANVSTADIHKAGYKKTPHIQKDIRVMRYDQYVLGIDEMPKDMAIVHLDGDYKNCNKDNLRLVKKEIAMSLYWRGWNKVSKEMAEVGIEVLTAKNMVNEYEKGLKNESKN